MSGLPAKVWNNWKQVFEGNSTLNVMRCPIENPYKTGETLTFVIIVVCLPIRMVSLWKGYAKKLRSIILLQFELITFRIVYWKTLKPIISMVSGFLNVSLSPQTIYFYLWRDQDPPNNSR